MVSWEYCARLTSPYWPPIVLRAFLLNKNVLLVFDFLQGGINLRNWIIHRNNKATIIAIILKSFQAFWRGWLNPRGRFFPSDTRVHLSTLEYTGVRWSTPEYTGVHWSTLEYTRVHKSTLECTGVHWSTQEYTRVHWSTLEYTGVHWSTLEYTRVHQSTLEYTRVH